MSLVLVAEARKSTDHGVLGRRGKMEEGRNQKGTQSVSDAEVEGHRQGGALPEMTNCKKKLFSRCL
jgi:hypothetical protein